jgi:hypothetical protein
MVDNATTVSLPEFDAPARVGVNTHARNLFLTGFLVLFLELACIRWFAANWRRCNRTTCRENKRAKLC